ncbi:MAG: Uncharacterised protein [Prochlorococcus marinus str. MIT 9215]|nr:MAG: Uncharacterised protein [Prochlorococcus marinus str. MIT 9215]
MVKLRCGDCENQQCAADQPCSVALIVDKETGQGSDPDVYPEWPIATGILLGALWLSTIGLNA